MSLEIEEIVSICEQLPEAKRVEVADFARFLLNRSPDAVPGAAMERWLTTAPCAAKPGVTTDEVMALTRGEP